jgi:hypothetical protein
MLKLVNTPENHVDRRVEVEDGWIKIWMRSLALT